MSEIRQGDKVKLLDPDEHSNVRFTMECQELMAKHVGEIAIAGPTGRWCACGEKYHPGAAGRGKRQVARQSDGAR